MNETNVKFFFSVFASFHETYFSFASLLNFDFKTFDL